MRANSALSDSSSRLGAWPPPWPSPRCRTDEPCGRLPVQAHQDRRPLCARRRRGHRHLPGRPENGETLKQSIIIDNRPGGATNIGMDIVARAPGDGYDSC